MLYEADRPFAVKGADGHLVGQVSREDVIAVLMQAEGA